MTPLLLRRLLLLALGLLCAADGCAKPPPRPLPPVTSRMARSCQLLPLMVEREGHGWEDKVSLPATGRLAFERHLATREEAFEKQPFPRTVTDGIDGHLRRSCDKLKALGAQTDCSDVYFTEELHQFSPAQEGGEIGEGATAKHKPPAAEEMWLIDVAFAPGHRAKSGQRWLLSANGRQVVAIAGYEASPLPWKFLGGAQAEVHWYLGTDDDSQITVHGPLKDQTLAPGPIHCP